MDNYVILVGCGKDKAKVKSPAKCLYTGILTRRAIAWAERSGLPYRILSAKYGCLDPAREIEPYELKLSSLSLDGRKRWAGAVTEILNREFPGHKFLALAGSEYLSHLDVGEIIDPMKGLGVGQRIRWLNTHPTINEVLSDNNEPSHVMKQVRSHFLDSGSFSHWSKAKKYAEKNRGDAWGYYNTPDFFGYMDRYAEFVLKHKDGIDHYANVDVIGNPELTWRNQKYLEKKGLHPIPVVHYRTDVKWIEKYIGAGYSFVAFGGLVGSMGQDSCRHWLDSAFSVTCRSSGNLPRVKIHGFGVSSWKIIVRYPWWSIDNTTFAKRAGFGEVIVPKMRRGQFTVLETPNSILFSDWKLPKIGSATKHYAGLSRREKEILLLWLSEIGVPLGENSSNGDIVCVGVMNHNVSRRIACLKYFEKIESDLPVWPWAFVPSSLRGGFIL